MQIKQIFLGILIAITLNSCINTIDGNGNVAHEKRNVAAFSKIDISGRFEVILNQGKEASLEIDENLLEIIETKVNNNTLFISSTEPIGNAKVLKLYITTVNLNDIDVSGAIELANKGVYETEKLEIEVSGAADIDLKLDVKNLFMEMSGASETTLSGSANNFEIEISGAGDLDAKKLNTKNTTVDISGAGSAIVFAKQTLNVNVSGAGSVQYKGNPKIKENVSGAGSVKKL